MKILLFVKIVCILLLFIVLGFFVNDHLSDFMYVFLTSLLLIYLIFGHEKLKKRINIEK